MSMKADFRVRADEFELSANFNLAARARVGVVGANGAGKTTLLRALAGLNSAQGTIESNGQVWLDGAKSLAPQSRRVGMVFQRGALLPMLDVLGNVAFGAIARGVSKDKAKVQAKAWLERVDASTLAGRSVDTLSGGEAKRVALARVFASEPKVLLLDEPLAGVDSDRRVEILALLQELLKDFTGPALIATHHAPLIRSLTSEVLLLDSGKVSGPTPIAEAIAQPASDFVAHFFGRAKLGEEWFDDAALAASSLSFEDAQKSRVKFVESTPQGFQVHAEDGKRALLRQGEPSPKLGADIWIGLSR